MWSFPNLLIAFFMRQRLPSASIHTRATLYIVPLTLSRCLFVVTYHLGIHSGELRYLFWNQEIRQTGFHWPISCRNRLSPRYHATLLLHRVHAHSRVAGYRW